MEQDRVIWVEGTEWPAELLPQPTAVVTLSAREIVHVADVHAAMASNALAGGDLEASKLHDARASYLRQRVADIAPYLLSPQITGRA